MNFGGALQVLRGGGRVARAGWNGRGMWLRLEGAEIPAVDRVQPPMREFIVLKDAQGWLVPWVASQTDLLAEDWVEVDV